MVHTMTTPTHDRRAPGPVDPSKNVLSLVDEAVKRLDDLREAAESKASEIANVRAQLGEKLREAESKRIDAIRSVDANAIAVAAEKQAAQAKVLADQVASTAEALRSLVATTAAAASTQFLSAVSQLTSRIQHLETAQSESKGRSGVLIAVATVAGALVSFLIQKALS